MANIPDQFLFINKNAKSGSLSHSRRKEKADIYSHVHSKYHKDKRLPKPLAGLGATVVKSKSEDLVAAAIRVGQTAPTSLVKSTSSVPKAPHKQRKTEPCDLIELSAPSPRVQLNASAVDPFYCSSITIDAKDRTLLRYPFTSFVETTFNAESLISHFTDSLAFRHKKAVTERLQRCVKDDLMMYTTLAYSASCKRWTLGEDEPERPAEMYILKAIEVLRLRLQRDELVDTWLLLSIYALAVSEMWAQHYDAATAHLKMICHFVDQLGGISNIEPYLMESILLCDKYVAIGKFEPPMLSLDWEPTSFPRLKMMKIQSSVKPILSSLGQGFLGLVGGVLGDKLLRIINDIVTCVQVAEFMTKESKPDENDQRWLFLRNQALVSHLLSLQSQSWVQECTRIALITWMLKITAYFGAQRWSKRLLPKLKAAIIRLELGTEWSPSTLLLWMTCLGAMTAEYTDEREWFLSRISLLARSLDIKVEKEAFRQILQRYLFLESEDGLQFFRMVRAAREMQDESETSY